MQEEIREIRTVKITRKGQVSIPSAVRARAGFEEGAKVNVIEGFEKPCFSVNLRVTVNFNNFIKVM